MIKWFFISVFLFASSSVFAQVTSDAKDDIEKGLNTRKERKSGYSFAGLPTVSYNSDIGMKYGAFGTLYFYGKQGKSIYPLYKHSLSFDYSVVSNGGSISQLYYSGNQLFDLPIKLAVDLCYQKDNNYQFYGYNGREAVFDSEYSDPDSPHFINSKYYRQHRNLFNVSFNIQGGIGKEGINWFLGFMYYKFKVSSADAENKNTLYDTYVNNQVIPYYEREGGQRNVIQLGMVYDTRDRMSNPMKGMWSELLLVSTPRIIGNRDLSFSKISLTHRQYFTLVPEKLSFALRVAAQWTFGARQAPSYMEALQFNTFSAVTVEGLGGYSTLRGILPNRIVGAGVAYSNLSLRWKFWKFYMFGQDFYCATNAYVDMGMVTQKHSYNYALSNIVPRNDCLHVAVGSGVHIAMNENFVMFINASHAINKQDGRGIVTNFSTSWLF